TISKKMPNELCLKPLDSARYVMQHAKHVSISIDGIKKVAAMISNKIMDGECTIEEWSKKPLHPKEANEQAIDWIFLVDTLNFSFWSDSNDSYEKVYKGKRYHGYEALCAAINQAIDNGIDILNASYYSQMTMTDFIKIFQSDSSYEMPLLNERLQVLHETGQILIDKYSGHFSNCIRQANLNAHTLLDFIVDNFPSYRDEAVYHAQRVSFYKRAQILIADIWACFRGQDLGHFHDIDTITMFADYRVPQVLFYYHVLIYTDKLVARLKHEMLPNGDKDEVEIRAAAIVATQLIVNCINEELPLEKDLGDGGSRINNILVDYYLWDLRREKQVELIETPFHRTRCIYY
ncbi:unnamed protein product, partial [Didymodactylos carnosus]